MKDLAYVLSSISLFFGFVFGLIWFFLVKDWAKISCFISIFNLIPWVLYLEKRGEN